MYDSCQNSRENSINNFMGHVIWQILKESEYTCIWNI